MQKMRTLATAAASTALVLGMAAPAFAGGDTGGHGGLKLHPSSGGPGTVVKVKALCRDGGHGTVASDAFEWSQAHTDGRRHHDRRHHDGENNLDNDVELNGADGKNTGGDPHRDHRRHRVFATAKVMNEGLTPGKKYEVTGYCKNHKRLTGTFTFTGGVGGAANAGLGGLAAESKSAAPGATTAAAVAGGLAVTGAAGYFLVWRRRTGGDQA
ncbi:MULTISPECIES: hypothetical protein [unclassified Streptomyces]|uniref:hypothetical protein n=1 Tax=unclassified Streptomyces TaxID=2593676 RepID=UPI0022B62C55|nr:MULTISPECIES: hypothetical protein [unclassified Streptomyces]MCZ7415345.1 hypothetical protein [Streptomyces sp. WMMC897]MCZ7432268.1 hypothetical protein [Streptomyces sp. WMMC1477]